MPGEAKIITYNNILEAEQERAAKGVTASAKRGQERPKHLKLGEGKGSCVDELEIGNREIKALGLEKYCSVLQF